MDKWLSPGSQSYARALWERVLADLVTQERRSPTQIRPQSALADQ